MADRVHKILIVEPDANIVEMLLAALARRFDAQVTCVSTAEECLDVEMLEPHDLVIAEMDLEDSNGSWLVEQLAALSARPMILLGDDPTRDEVIAAMSSGASDLFIKPFALTDLLDAVRRALRNHELRRQHQVRHRRLRELVRNVIRERRHLRRRVELICRDLVGAHRRLVHRVLDSETTKSRPAR